jgi:DNA-binding CsgD family transcriptional regulator
MVAVPSATMLISRFSIGAADRWARQPRSARSRFETTDVPEVRTAKPRPYVLDHMRVVLVGPSLRRDRLRARLPDDFEVVGEAATLSEARRVLDVDAYLVTAAAADLDEAAPLEALTARELDVVAHLAEGLSNKAIAARLGISDETVKFHLSAIFGKLQATNRTDAVRQALRRGVVEV